MSGLRVHNSNVQRTPQSGGVRVNPGALRTGDAAAAAATGNAVGGALGDLSGVAGEFAHAENESKLSDLTRQRELRYNETMNVLASEPDAAKHQKIVDDFYAENKKLGGDLKGSVADSWKLESDGRDIDYDARFKYIHRVTRRDGIAKTNSANWEGALRDQDEISLAKIAASNVEAGLWTQEQGHEALYQAKRQIVWDEVQAGIMADPDAVKEKLSGAKWKEQYPEFTEKDRAALLQDARVQSRYQQSEAAAEQKSLEHQTEGQMWNMHIDGKLLPSHIREAFNTGKISATTRDNYMSRISAKKIETDRSVEFSIRRAIRDYKLGDRQFDDVEKMIKDNSKKLDDTDYPGLQKALYSAEESVNKGEVDVAREERIKWGEDHLEQMFKDEEGKFGPSDKVGHATLYGKRLKQWQQFWDSKEDPTDDQVTKFMNLLTSDVYDNWFGGGFKDHYDTEEMVKIDSQINQTLGEAGVGVTFSKFMLDTVTEDVPEGALLDIEPEDYEDFANTIAGIDDDNIAKQYYEKWKSKWLK